MFCVSTDFLIAHGTFAKEGGTVVDVRNEGFGQYLIPAQFWSDYVEEREYFFIGGLQGFEFISIHDIALKHDYKAFIVPLSAMMQMFRGFPFRVRALKKSDSKALRRLISDRLSRTDSDSTLPPYLRRLFANITHNVHTVEINMDLFEWKGSSTQFSYIPFKPLFCAQPDSNEESIAFALFLQLFGRKLDFIVVYHGHYGFKPSIGLNDSFVRALCSAFDVVSGSFRLQQRFKSIVIVEPKQEIAVFIEQNQAVFEQKGWTMKQGSYKHIRRGCESDNALIITQI